MKALGSSRFLRVTYTLLLVTSQRDPNCLCFFHSTSFIINDYNVNGALSLHALLIIRWSCSWFYFYLF
ncbi:unnamed protein product, partial [Amoebophrya sp. A25]|eukprot:GSA25T00003852001.1